MTRKVLLKLWSKSLAAYCEHPVNHQHSINVRTIIGQKKKNPTTFRIIMMICLTISSFQLQYCKKRRTFTQVWIANKRYKPYCEAPSPTPCQTSSKFRSCESLIDVDVFNFNCNPLVLLYRPYKIQSRR